RGFLKAVEYLGQYRAQDVRSALAYVYSAVVRTAVIAAEAHTASQASCLHEPAELILVTPEPKFLFSDEGGFIGRPRLALLPREHFLRSEELDRFMVYPVVEGHSPKHTLSFLLTTCPQFRSESLERVAILGKMQVNHHVATNDLAAMNG